MRDGQNALVDAFAGSEGEGRDPDGAVDVQRRPATCCTRYVPVDDADAARREELPRAAARTRLYDTWCDALAANVAYAQRLRDAGTPCRSVVVVITDGEDVGSQAHAPATARGCRRTCSRREQFMLAFVGVGNDVDFHKVARAMGVPDGCVAVQTRRPRARCARCSRW